MELYFQHSQRVHVVIWYILGLSSRYMGTPLGPKYIPYTYMDPLGLLSKFLHFAPCSQSGSSNIFSP